MKTPNTIYKEFWKPIIEDKKGSIKIMQLKKELADFHNMIDNVPRVYSEVTGGLVSCPTTKAGTILSIFEEKFSENNITKSDVQDAIKAEKTYKGLVSFLKDYFEIGE